MYLSSHLSGYVAPSASVFIGAVASAISNTAVNFRHKLPWDDGLDIFGGHAISGKTPGL